MSDFTPPADVPRLRCIDAHTAGEPLRIPVAGWPTPEGKTILERRRYAREHQDHLRRALMWEPRGHADMYGCLIVPPERPDSDFGVLFMHNEGYSTMCGHGIIAIVKVALECGLVDAVLATRPIRIDTPAGLVVARAQLDARASEALGRPAVNSVSFENVASFLLHRDRSIEVPGHGSITCDIAYGGAFYAYVDADSVGLHVGPDGQNWSIEIGMAIKNAVMEQVPLSHPDGDPDLEFLYGTILTALGPGPFQDQDPTIHSRNVCVFADGEVDRSPTGTGVSGRAAIHHAKGELALGDSIRIASLIGTTFDVRALREVDLHGTPAIVPEVRGQAHLTGRSEFWLDPADPVGPGFLLRG